jgi:hypothetical protein
MFAVSLSRSTYKKKINPGFGFLLGSNHSWWPLLAYVSGHVGIQKDEPELRVPVPNITHPTAVSDRVTATKLTFVPQERMDSCGQAICHASTTICLLSRDAAAQRQQEVRTAASSSRSNSFFPRTVRGEGETLIMTARLMKGVRRGRGATAGPR